VSARGTAAPRHDHAVPRVRVDVADVPARVGAGGGHDRVQPARALGGARHRSLRLARMRQIDLLEREPVRRCDAVEHDRGSSFLLDRRGHRGAEAGRAAGDEDGSQRFSGHVQGPP
jgi:hypothetical protein